MMTEEKRAVDTAANWLDENHPGWYANIDADTLVMQSPCKCVGGQMSGGDWHYWLVLNREFDAALGIPTYPQEMDQYMLKSVFANYDWHWKEAIRERQNGD